MGRVADYFETQIGEFGAQVGERERLDCFEMYLADDRRRRPCRREQSVPIRNFEARIAGLGDGRELWSRRGAL